MHDSSVSAYAPVNTSPLSPLLPLKLPMHYRIVAVSLYYCITSNESELHFIMDDIKMKWHIAFHLQCWKREGYNSGYWNSVDFDSSHVTRALTFCKLPVRQVTEARK